MKECNTVKQSPLAGLAAYGGGSGSVIFGRKGVGGYQIERSLRFNDPDEAYLSSTISGNITTFTYSFWVKRCVLGNRDEILDTPSSTGFYLYFDADGYIKINDNTQNIFTSNGQYRDPSAWMNVIVNNNGSTFNLYVNGVLDKTATITTKLYSGAIEIGSDHTTDAPDYYLADVHFIDGQALAPTEFGETNDDGIWDPKKYTGSFGSNGAYLKFADNSSNAALGTDSSGNNNTWTVNNFVAGQFSPTVTSTGDPTSSTDSPFSSGYSVDFDGNDSLRIVGPGTISGDFTVECFIKSSDYGGIQRFFSADQASQSGERLNLRCYNGNTEFYVAPGVSASGTNLPTNQWNHIAITRSGSTVSYYLNGSRWATDTHSSAISVTTLVVAHGFGSEYFTGKVSNARFVDKQALYTGSSYTQPTSTLTTTSQGASADNVRIICCHQSSVTAAQGTLSAASDIDSLFDSPTDGTQSDTGAGGEVSGNYCTLNPLESALTGINNGNLNSGSSGASSWKICTSTMAVSSGKYYWEGFTDTTANSSQGWQFGFCQISPSSLTTPYGTGKWSYQDGTVYYQGSSSNVSTTAVANDLLAYALDMDAGTCKLYVNNSLVHTFTGITGTITPFVGSYSTPTVTVNFGARSFAYNAPSGFKTLCTKNLPDPTIADGANYFDTKLYTGNGSTQSISLSTAPDLLWLKSRSASKLHALCDSVRGDGKLLYSSSTLAEQDIGASVVDLTSSGFNLGFNSGFTQVSHNHNGETLVAWAWNAGANSNRTYTVKVVSDSGNKYRFDGHGTSAVTLDLAEGSTYVFDQSDSSNGGHPLRFSTTANGTHGGGTEYTTGVTVTGTPGQAGAKTTIVIAAGAPTLFYYCTQHSGMGGQINTNSTAGATVLSGSLNSSSYDQTTTWSSLMSGHSQNAASAFDGNGTTYAEANSGATIEIDLSTYSITATSRLQVMNDPAFTGSTDVQYKIYTTSSSTPAFSKVIGGTQSFDEASSNWSSAAITKITVRGLNEGARISKVIYDGKTLVNTSTTPPNLPSMNSVVKANPEAGFSVVKYTGNSSGGSGNIGHSLGAAPDMIIFKTRDVADNWAIYHSSLGVAYLEFTTSAQGGNAQNRWSSLPTSSVINLGSDTNINTKNHIMYTWTAVKGFSAFGSYTGNGSSDGPFVHTGFRVAWLMIKNASTAGETWTIYDSTRDVDNTAKQRLQPNSNDAESVGSSARFKDLLSNGFKIRGTSGEQNTSGDVYIYAAFAEHPFKTARAR